MALLKQGQHNVHRGQAGPEHRHVVVRLDRLERDAERVGAVDVARTACQSVHVRRRGGAHAQSGTVVLADAAIGRGQAYALAVGAERQVDGAPGITSIGAAAGRQSSSSRPNESEM